MSIVRMSLLLFVASSALASPVITSVSPTEGPVFGGTTVVIRGSGFSDNCVICSPPFGGLSVFFGDTRASEVKLIEPTVIEAIAPAHLPGTVDVTVQQMDGSNPNQFTLPNAFTFTGESYAAYAPILFPIFMPPVTGAFGSDFRTTARVASKGEPLDLYGVDNNCLLLSPVIPPEVPVPIGNTDTMLPTACSQSVGRFFFVRPAQADDLAANLRVADISRERDSHGVEIPVVRRDDFTYGRIMLLGVPVDPRFRNTLRIYGLPGGAQFVTVTINGVTRGVPLTPGTTLFEPSYAQFTDFPTAAQLQAGQRTVTVTIDQDPRGFVGPTAVWAFVSVTNNETQEITIVTPN
jgi:hypothetical protein